MASRLEEETQREDQIPCKVCEEERVCMFLRDERKDPKEYSETAE